MKSEMEIREKLAELRKRFDELSRPMEDGEDMSFAAEERERCGRLCWVSHEITILEWMLGEKGAYRPSWETPVDEGIPP